MTRKGVTHDTHSEQNTIRPGFVCFAQPVRLDRNDTRNREGCDHMKADRHRYEMQIETPSGISSDESVRRLRAFLKMAIRSYSIRCLSVVRITHGSQEAVEDASESPPMVISDK